MNRLKIIGKLLVRLVSIIVGSLIEYREIYTVHNAQWIIVLLGLWFIVIPPALWLDSLRKLMRISDNLSDTNPKE